MRGHIILVNGSKINVPIFITRSYKEKGVIFVEDPVILIEMPQNQNLLIYLFYEQSFVLV